MRFIIYTPIGTRTGGPTALHQLFRCLNDLGEIALILPTPETINKAPVPSYQNYEPQYISISELTREDILIVPEYLRSVPRSVFQSVGKVVIWWLSVDNSPHFYGNENLLSAAKIKKDWIQFDEEQKRNLFLNEIKKAIETKDFKGLSIFFYFKVITFFDRLKEILRQQNSIELDLTNQFHLFQSEYARVSIQSSFNLFGLMVTDYIEDLGTPMAPINESPSTDRSLIAYNGTKGGDLVRALEQTLSKEIDFIPLKGFNDNELASIFAKADLYLDLGHLPGKDRLPREALAHGCPIVISTLGAGKNDIDFPIPQHYKLELNCMDNVAKNIFEIVLNGKENNLLAQNNYRMQISTDKYSFYKEVKTFVDFFRISNSGTN